MKVCSNGPGHMTKMAAMPIYGKKNLLWNRKSDDLETCYADPLEGHRIKILPV